MPDPRRRFVVAIVVATAALAALGSVLTLVGWATDTQRLTDWFGAGVSMMPNAAVAALCAGVGLSLLLQSHRRRAVVAVASVVVAIGAATLCEHVLRVDLGIDRLVFPRDWGQAATVSAGRMGVPASLDFTLLGTAMLLATGGARARQLAAWGAVAAGVIAMLSVVGSLYGASTLFTLPELTAIAPQTSIMMAGLAAGTIAALPETQPMRTLLGRSAAAALVRRALPFTLLVPIAVGFVRLEGQNAGLYDTAFGAAMRTIVESALLLGLLAWTAAAVRNHERSLEDSRARLENILGSINDQFLAVDRDGRLTYCNAAMRRLLDAHGVDAGALLGQRVLDVAPALARVPAVERLRVALERGAELEFEAEIDAWQRWFSLRASPTPDRGLAIVAQDVTERRRADAALRASEAELRLQTKRLSGFLDTAALGLHRVGSDGTILWANDAELALLGYERDDYVGHDIKKFHACAETIADILARLQRGERLVGHPATMRCRDGSIREVVIDSSVLWDGDRFVHTQCFTRDVTEQRRLERELHQRMTELRDADRRKDEFLATLAHELRNPLAPIRNMLEVLRHTGATPDAVHQARTIMERQLRHMTRLIDDLLDISRISTGRVVLRTNRTELTAVVQHALDGASPAISAARHRLTVVLPPHPVDVHADPIRLAQIIGNLLDNACKYTEAGGNGHITVRVETDGTDATVRVRDNGIGVPPDMLAHIFDMFTQVDRSVARTQDGLGIGLSLVKRLVEMHGGTVSAHSAGPGEGCEMVVRLPVLPPAVAETPPAAPAPPAIRGHRILVVDDNRDSAASLAMLLELSGNTVRTASDGLDALATAGTFQPEIVLLDIGMPRMDGYEVARRLRSGPRGTQLVILAVTGYGQEQDRQRAKAAGFDAHLVKPLEPDALAATLDRLLRPQPAR